MRKPAIFLLLLLTLFVALADQAEDFVMSLGTVLVLVVVGWVLLRVVEGTEARKQEAADRRRKADEEFLAKARQSGIPPGPKTDLILKKGESVALCERGTLFETRTGYITSGFETSSGAHIGSIGSSEEMKEVDDGEVILTDRRIVFMGENESRDISLEEILKSSVDEDLLEISYGKGARNCHFKVEYPYRWNGLVKGLIAGELKVAKEGG